MLGRLEEVFLGLALEWKMPGAFSFFHAQRITPSPMLSLGNALS